MRTKPFIVKWDHSSKNLLKSLYINGHNWVDSVDDYEDLPRDEAIDVMNEVYSRKGGGSTHMLIEALLEKGLEPIRLASLSYACGCVMFEQTPIEALPLVKPVFIGSNTKSEGIEKIQKIISKHKGVDVGGVTSIIALGSLTAFMFKYKGKGDDVSKEKALSILGGCSKCPKKEECETKRNSCPDEFIKAEEFDNPKVN